MTAKVLGVFALLAMAAAPGRMRILILGDSLTEGFGVDPKQAYPALVQKKLDSLFPGKYEVLGAGISGSTTASALGRLKWHAKAKPDFVLITLGSNDGLRGIPVAKTRANLEAAVDYCRERGWGVALAGLKVPPNYGREYAGNFERLYPDLAREKGIPLLPFLLAGVAGEGGLNQADGIHPNEEGQRRMAETVSAFLIQKAFPAWERASKPSSGNTERPKQ
jgi:acyl-CoA thioesterase-1